MVMDKSRSEHIAKPTQASKVGSGRLGSEPASDLLSAFEKHHSALKRFIARYLSSQHDIEDVAQESFLRAFKAGMDYDVRQPKSFLFRIAKNVAVSQLRLKSQQITDYIEDQSNAELMCDEWTLEDDLIARERLGVHCDAVAALSPQSRRVYILRKVHGLSHKEIAARMGIGQKTVEKHLYKGIAACDNYVQEKLNTDSLLDQAQPLGTKLGANVNQQTVKGGKTNG